jgi:hypothetical protein
VSHVVLCYDLVTVCAFAGTGGTEDDNVLHKKK